MKKKLRSKGKQVLAIVLMAALMLPGAMPVMADSAGFSFEDFDGMSDSEIKGWLNDEEATGSDAEPATKSDTKKSMIATLSNAEMATPSIAIYAIGASSLGDLWDNWTADFTFLNGQSGVGTKERPYQIKNKNQLMGLSQLAAMGMKVQAGEGDTEIVGDYEGAYFKLMANIDLNGMEWIPIGFYQDSSQMTGEITRPFCGNFDGNGKTISNFKLNHTDWSNVGFFGAIENASVENLTLKPGKTVYGKNNVAILAGSSTDSRIGDCKVSGSISAAGNVGGITAEAAGSNSSNSNSVIENCEANVTIDANGSTELYVGGITGKAAETSIVDCRVETGDNNTARIQGKGIVGGITGFQNSSDIYNCYVSGTIGGTGSKVIGGVTGMYGSGHMKVVRFEGTVGQSGLGSGGRRGTFIGHRESGNYYRFGEDIAYLFADTESKIAFNICGSEIPDDNEYTYAAHIGYSHSNDLYYSLVQGGNSKDITDTYYYQELENGILSVIDDDNGGADGESLGYNIDHFAPNDAGRPTRGYLVSIPQIDTVSNGTSYYNVATLEVKGNSSYYRTINKEHRGAIAPGKSVTVITSPNNTEDAKFQMVGVPTYTKNGNTHNTTYINGGEYTFTMPTENTEVKATYKKVAVTVSVIPTTYNISVIEERTGNRKKPVKTTKVLNGDGKLIATYINGSLEQGTQIQPVNIQAIVDTNNDVADNSVKWSVDDPELITLLSNDDEDMEGYTKKSASIRVNLDAGFFIDTIRQLETTQATNNYQYPIPDTIYGAGHQNGGVAILTASTRPAASFEGKPCTDNCRINITFQIKDKTYVANEGATLDKESLAYVVTRKLTGDRKNPQESIQVTPPQTLAASFHPDFFDKKDITWKADDTALITVDGENKSASVSVKQDAKWIQDIIASDNGIHANNLYAELHGSGTKNAVVTVVADDMLGNRQTADCAVTIQFVTEDQTKILVESITVEPMTAERNLVCSKTGGRTNPVITWSGTEPIQLQGTILPVLAFNKEISWQTSDDALFVDKNGTVTINTGAKWIQVLNQKYPAEGSHTSIITAITADGGFKAACTVKLNYKLTDNTYSSGGGSHGGGSGGGSGGGGGGSSSGVTPSGGVGPAGNGPAATTAPTGSIVGTWVNTADGKWAFTANGRTYNKEWAYIHNPFAGKDQSNTDWFRFDETGHMVIGWYTDLDGNVYYLYPISDGTLGHMVTGWQWIMGEDGIQRCYYFNPVSDGTRGALYRNRLTPDGKTVNENGEWTINGVIQMK